MKTEMSLIQQKTLFKKKEYAKLIKAYYDITEEATKRINRDISYIKPIIDSAIHKVTLGQYVGCLQKMVKILDLDTRTKKDVCDEFIADIKGVEKYVKGIFERYPLEMPSTKIQYLRNKISELKSKGKHANEIAAELNLITRPELIQVIIDLLENPPKKGA